MLDGTSVFLFLLTAFFFSTVFFPEFWTRLADNFTSQRQLTIHGVVEHKPTEDAKAERIINAKVRAGGVLTSSDVNGVFSLVIDLHNTDSVPLSVRHKRADTLVYLPVSDVTVPDTVHCRILTQ